MNLDQIATKCFILALFIRDDGQRLLLGDGYYDFNQKLQHFQGNTIANDVVEIQGDNGQLLAGQVMRSGTQKFEGYIGDATTNRQIIEQKRSEFMAFFRIKHFYKVVYIFPDGTAIQRQRGYLTDAPTIPEIFQKFPEYSIALNFEDANYYEYAEDDHGDEIYAHIAELALAGEAIGGLIWDAIGAVTNGITWSGIQTAQGEYISITNELSLEAPLASVEMLGKAEQAGTPAPDSPQPISVVTGENVAKIEGKNLFELTASTRTDAGVVFTKTNDTITAVGTTTRGAYAENLSIYDNFSGLGNYPAYATTTATNSFQLPAGTYTFSANITNTGNTTGGLNIGVGTLGARVSTSTKLEKTAGTSGTASATVSVADGQYVLLSVWYEGTANTPNVNLSINQVQLEKGSSASSFEPYQGQEFEVDLGSIELCKIGNYQDKIYKTDGKWYIEKQVGKVVLDGSENWALASMFYCTSPLQNIAECITPSGGNVMSDYFTWSSGAQNNRTIDIVGAYIIRIRDTDFADVATLKTWLGTHNTTVYYALATPTTTEITNEALIAQLDALGASSLYVGVNNIGTETLNAMPTLKIEYYTEYTLDGAGYEWEPGGNTAKTIVTVAGVDSAWPIWTIQGGAQNPTLTNITTGQTISWQGFVPAGQTLTINMAEMTADLAGANVFEYITGEWIRLAPGNNTLVYTAGNADKPSTLSWNGVLA